MRFPEFARTLEALENTSSRLEMYSQLADLFGKAGAEEVAALAYLLEGRLLPAFGGVETGVGLRKDPRPGRSRPSLEGHLKP